MNRRGLSKEEAQGLALFIVIAVVTIWIIVLKIKIGIIHLFQDLFWISLVIAALSLVSFAGFIVWGIFKRNNDHSYYSEFFTKGVIFIFAGGFILISFIFLLITAYSYEQGYSDEALEKLANYESQLQSLEQLRSVLTGEIIWDIENQAIQQIIDSSCQTPNFPCENTKRSFEVYKSIKGMKDDADDVAQFLGLIEKVVK